MTHSNSSLTQWIIQSTHSFTEAVSHLSETQRALGHRYQKECCIIWVLSYNPLKTKHITSSVSDEEAVHEVHHLHVRLVNESTVGKQFSTKTLSYQNSTRKHMAYQCSMFLEMHLCHVNTALWLIKYMFIAKHMGSELFLIIVVSETCG